MLQTGEEKSGIFSCGLHQKTTQEVLAGFFLDENVCLHNWRGRGKQHKYAGTLKKKKYLLDKQPRSHNQWNGSAQE